MRIILKTGILLLALVTTLLSCRQVEQQKAQRDAKELNSIAKTEQVRDSLLLDSIKKATLNPPEQTGSRAGYGKQR